MSTLYLTSRHVPHISDPLCPNLKETMGYVLIGVSHTNTAVSNLNQT